VEDNALDEAEKFFPAAIKSLRRRFSHA